MGISAAQRKNDKAALKAYLQQYSTAMRQRDAIKRRAAAFAAKTGPAAEAMSVRLKKQQAQLTRAIQATADAIELLPPASLERAAIEMRHIDCASWTKIANRLYVSRSTAFNYYNRGLERMLEDKTVRQRVRKYARQENK